MNDAPDSSDSSAAQMVLRALTERIEAGGYRLGGLMPTESQLMAEFGASRFSVRKALSGLADAGYVERRQGMGTRVIAQRAQTSFRLAFNSITDIFQVNPDERYVPLGSDRVAIDAACAPRIGGQPGEVWLRLIGRRQRVDDRQSVCFIHSYVRPRHIGHELPLARHRGTLATMLEELTGEAITEVVQQVRALGLSADAADALDRPSGSIGLEVMRRYHSESGVLLASFNWYPAEEMTYELHLRRGSGTAG